MPAPEAVEDGDLVVLHTTMSGRHARTFVGYGPDGRPSDAFPATGRTFAVTQTHWYRLADGLVVEHWANRDDIGQATQLGWVPPSLPYLMRMATALRKARREQRPRSRADGPARRAACHHLPVIGVPALPMSRSRRC